MGYDINGNLLNGGNSHNIINIPIVGFETYGAIPKSKSDGNVTAQMYFRSETINFDCYATMAIQGSSSQYYPKKNYTIKLFKDYEKTTKNKIEFFDWGATNKYVIKANWTDHSHARNIVNARLWAQIMRSRTDFDTLPTQLRNSHFSTDGFPVKMYFNGIYQGIYTVILPKDALYGLDDSIDENALLESDPVTAGTYGCAYFKLDSNDGAWGDETHDEMPLVITNAWNDILTFVNSSSDENFVANFQTHFDKQSVIDRHIFIYLALILDDVAKNQFYFTYDATKWYGGMWDLDGTWGCSPFPPSHPDWYNYDDPFQPGSSNKFHERLSNLFASDIRTRYSELRQSILSESHILTEFDRFMNTIPPYLYEEDYAETTADGAYTDIPLKDTNNILQIRNFVNARCAYVDSMILT